MVGKGGGIVIVDACSSGVEAREAAMVGGAADEVLGADTGTSATVAAVVPCNKNTANRV